MSDVTRDTWNQVMAMSSGIDLLMGPNNTDRYLFDPKRLCFFLSRYKFAAKMLKRCHSIVDVGCGDGMGTITYLADTRATRVLGVDFDERLIAHATDALHPAFSRALPKKASCLEFSCVDILNDDITFGIFEGLSSLDVIEHIEEKLEANFISRLADLLVDKGVAVIGTPNHAARIFASKESEVGHINNYDAPRLQKSLEERFGRVFMFSMNDEVVHTGFDKMAHYLIAVCVK